MELYLGSQVPVKESMCKTQNLQEKNERFARLNLILKDEGLTKLQNATVMVEDITE